MEITGEYKIAAPRQDVWDALNDPDVLRATIPGCEALELLAENQFSARVLSKIGPVKAKFNCKVTLTNLRPPEHYTLEGEGQGGVAGFASGSADVSLSEHSPTETTLKYRSEIKIGGKLAQIGSRLVVGATRKIADQFFSNFAQFMESKST